MASWFWQLRPDAVELANKVVLLVSEDLIWAKGPGLWTLPRLRKTLEAEGEGGFMEFVVSR